MYATSRGDARSKQSGWSSGYGRSEENRTTCVVCRRCEVGEGVDALDEDEVESSTAAAFEEEPVDTNIARNIENL